MDDSLNNPEIGQKRKLKWLMFSRLLFTSLLLGSTILLQLSQAPSPMDRPLLVLYGLITGIFLLSFIYILVLRLIKKQTFFTFIQIGLDTVVVSLVLIVTGGFSSIFSFLYLVVIIYSSIFLFRKGNMVIAALCSIQYCILVFFEYYGMLNPYVMEGELTAASYGWNFVLYKILITSVACFAAAFLSGLLAEQTRKTQRELLSLENHVKRVEKLAYMGEMAAGLAHEIRNPLASLAGSIQLLKEDIQYNPDHEKLMQIALRETGRLSSLVNNFLLFARPPEGKIELIKLDVAINDILELYKNDYSFDNRISISCKLSPDIWIGMDVFHLRQVFWNLLINAAEAIQGQGRIEIKMVPVKDFFVVINVTDNGCGIPGEIIQSVFDPFFTTKPKGTGLGLSIAHNILESYNSRLEIQSELNIGTTFSLKFKRVASPT